MAFVDFRSTGPDLETLTAATVRALQQSQRSIGREVAKVGRKAILDDVRASRGSLRMMGGRLGVKPKVEATAAGATVRLSATPAGPWAIVDTGAKAHEIEPHRRALKFDGMYAPRVRHPGVAGSRAWTRAEPALDKAVTPTVEDATDKAMEV